MTSARVCYQRSPCSLPCGGGPCLQDSESLHEFEQAVAKLRHDVANRYAPDIIDDDLAAVRRAYINMRGGQG